jgi:hypothetical protein
MDAERIVGRLTELSKKSFAPLPQVTEWPAQIDLEEWHMSPELLSLNGSAEYALLNDRQRKIYSFYELVNFFSLNIQGERFLLAGLAEQIYGRLHQPTFEYIHHFIDEENKHLNYFGTFCTKYARIYPDRKVTFPREYEPGENEFLFFAKVLVFEEIVDFYNVTMAADTRLATIVRTMNEMHHMDEVRHLAFGKITVIDLWERFSPKWSAQTRQQVSQYLGNYILATCREYYNPDAYRDAGLDDPYGLMDVAFENARPLRKRATRRVTEFLRENAILVDEPAL